MARNLLHAVIGVTLVAIGGLWVALELHSEWIRRLLRKHSGDRLLWSTAWALAVIDLLLSLLPQPGRVAGGALPDKLIHVAAYMILTVAFLLAAVWRPGRGEGRWPNGAAAVVFATGAFGLLVEVLQGFYGRDAEVFDVVANFLGCIAALLAWQTVVAGEQESTMPREVTAVPDVTQFHDNPRVGSVSSFEAVELQRVNGGRTWPSQARPRWSPERREAGAQQSERHVRVHMRDGRRIEGWTRSYSVTSRPRVIFMSHVTTRNSQGAEIVGSPLDYVLRASQVEAVDFFDG